MQDETDRQSEARAKKTIVYGSDAMNEGLVKLILGFMDCLVDRLVNHTNTRFFFLWNHCAIGRGLMVSRY